jgi:tRNA dimethylallyltransferase
VAVDREQPVVVIAGPTGVGKTELSVQVAEEIRGEIVNYDSIQLYRGFDIGSAKPSPAMRARIPHHLFDIVDPTEEMNAAQYGSLASVTCAGIASRGRRPVLTGGTGFYLRAFLSGLPEMAPRNEVIRSKIRRIRDRNGGEQRLHRLLQRIDPAAAARLAPGDRHRIERALEVYMATGLPISAFPPPVAGRRTRPATLLALRLERTALVKRLEARVETMYGDGLIEETRSLLDRYPATSRPFSSIGYAEAVQVIIGKIDRLSAIAETKRRTRAYAKRQMTWLRGEPDIHWLDAARGIKDNLAAAIRQIELDRQSEESPT